MLAKKKKKALISSSVEEDDLLLRSSKKVKNGDSVLNESDWPTLGSAGKKDWVSGPSFAEKLQGIRGDGKKEGRAEDVAALTDDSMSDDEPEEVEDCEPLCVIREDPNRNFPSFSFSEKMKRRLYKAWDKAVIVKLLGRNIGYKVLLSILQSLWAKKGVISLINIGNGFFVVKMTNRDDYFNALTSAPWMLFDHYLTVCPWEPRFNPKRATIDKVAVWVRMPRVAEGNAGGKVELEGTSKMVTNSDDSEVWRVVHKPIRRKKGGAEKKFDADRNQGNGSRFGVLATGTEEGQAAVLDGNMEDIVVIQGSGTSTVERQRLVKDVRRWKGSSFAGYGLDSPLERDLGLVVFTSLPHDPGEVDRGIELQGKFWADSVDPDIELVDETPLEAMGIEASFDGGIGVNAEVGEVGPKAQGA
ncbi:hypothetical protein K1719_013493 [Acacia pycnantha]|nr:hypothetical protein K1719_013493 [Acacia pycnantha]